MSAPGKRDAMAEWTTEDVRHRFMIDARNQAGPWIHGDSVGQESAERAGRDFDRWLSRHDVEVAAKALEDAALSDTEGKLLPGVVGASWLRSRAATIRAEAQR